jgi:membrane fusion protein (multidrug efflux system)
MKTIKLSIAGTIVLFLMFSCSSNKQSQLSKLREQQIAIAGKIKTLESEIRAGQKDSLIPAKFKLVALKDVEINTFDHFVRVQGKLDGDQNAAVFADAPGTISS